MRKRRGTSFIIIVKSISLGGVLDRDKMEHFMGKGECPGFLTGEPLTLSGAK